MVVSSLLLLLIVRNRDQHKTNVPHATKLAILSLPFEGMELKEQSIMKCVRL
jgi:hypothetical protein